MAGRLRLVTAAVPVVAALGFALFIPQFFFPQLVRVAHGLLVAAGCGWLAATLWRQAAAGPQSAAK